MNRGQNEDKAWISKRGCYIITVISNLTAKVLMLSLNMLRTKEKLKKY